MERARGREKRELSFASSKIRSNAYLIETPRHLLIMLHPQRAANCNLASFLHHLEERFQWHQHSDTHVIVKEMETTISTFQGCNIHMNNRVFDSTSRFSFLVLIPQKQSFTAY